MVTHTSSTKFRRQRQDVELGQPRLLNTLQASLNYKVRLKQTQTLKFGNNLICISKITGNQVNQTCVKAQLEVREEARY